MVYDAIASRADPPRDEPDWYNGVGVDTDQGRFGIAKRDDGIEVLLGGTLVWSSTCAMGNAPVSDEAKVAAWRRCCDPPRDELPVCVVRLRALHEDVREEIESAFEHGTSLAGFDKASRDTVWRALQWLATAPAPAILNWRCEHCGWTGKGSDGYGTHMCRNKPASAIVAARGSDVGRIRQWLEYGEQDDPPMDCFEDATVLDRDELLRMADKLDEAHSGNGYHHDVAFELRALLEESEE